MNKLLLFLSILLGSVFLVPESRAQLTTNRPPGKLLPIVPVITAPTQTTPPAPVETSAYLLVYFKDETHSIYFATSADGYTFTDVNDGQPVLWGADLAEQKGVRDPHIMRGPDNAFYLCMTDLHIYGQKAGYRNTEWERPGELYSWGNNRGLVFMKSYDLIHWTHAEVRVDQLFPAEYGEAGCAWAPETIYDPGAGKLMVYFTTRLKAGPNFMVYAYADDAFTTLKTVPKQLFTHPNEKVNTIDGDITLFQGKYHLIYCAHESRAACGSRFPTGSMRAMPMILKKWILRKWPAKPPMSGTGTARIRMS